MRTTLNIPDDLAKEAKRRALEEGGTLTDLLVRGLRSQLGSKLGNRPLPVSSAQGGLARGLRWDRLEPARAEDDAYR